MTSHTEPGGGATDDTPAADLPTEAGGPATGDGPIANILAGTTFLALGGAFAIGSLRYDIGSALRMGPGYVPLVLGVGLAALGLAIAMQGVLARIRPTSAEPGPAPHPGQERGPVPWVRGGLLISSVMVFGLTVQGLGLAIALFAATYLAALAGHRNGPIRSAVVAAGLTGMSLVIFVNLLQLRLPLFGEWLGG